MSCHVFERVSDNTRAKLREPYPPLPMASADENVTIMMNRLDGDKGDFSFKVSLEADFREIKRQVETQWSIPTSEQVIVFRGRQVLEEDAFQPFIMPDVQEIIEQLGDDSLKMSVFQRPNKTLAFLRQEGLLIKGVPDLNQKTKHGASALHRAVRHFQVSVVKDLLASPSFTLANAVDKQKQSALHVAVQCRFREICQLLLVGQPKFTAVSCVDAKGQTALHLAGNWGDAKVVRMILEHEDFTEEHTNLRDDQGFTALQYATDCGHEDARRIILEFAPPSEEAVSTSSFTGGVQCNDILHDNDSSQHARSSPPPSLGEPVDISKVRRATSDVPSLNWAALCLNILSQGPP